MRRKLAWLLSFSMLFSSLPVNSLTGLAEDIPSEILFEEEDGDLFVEEEGLFSEDTSWDSAEEMDPSVAWDEELLALDEEPEADLAQVEGSDPDGFIDGMMDETLPAELDPDAGSGPDEEADIYEADNAGTGNADGVLADGFVLEEDLAETVPEASQSLDVLPEEEAMEGPAVGTLYAAGPEEELTMDALPEEEEMFAEYVNTVFYAGESSVTAASDSSWYQSVSDGTGIVYSFLRDAVSRIANGTVSSTVIEIPLSAFGYTTEDTFSAEDLGIEAIVTDGGMADDVVTAMYAKLDYDMSAALDRLQASCPYELYWYDKTSSTSSDGCLVGAVNDGTGWKAHFKADDGIALTISMPVSTEYVGTALYTVDTEKTGAAVTAASNAMAIVDAYAGASDLDKLYGYRDAICERVSYNDAAAGNQGTPYGNPWQMIYVFDDDWSNQVVCEGYSKAFQYLCDQTAFADSSIASYLVSGDMNGGTGAGPHMWNLLRAGGESYLVDVTNSDEGSIGSRGGLFLAGASSYLTNGYAITRPEETITEEIDGGTRTVTYPGFTINYVYDADTLSLYQPGLLTIADHEYVPGEPETEPQSEPETEPYSEPETEPQSETQTEPQTEPQSESETEPYSEPQTEPQSEPETEPYSEPETEPQSEPETEPYSEPQTEPQSEPETEPYSEPETEPYSEPETEPYSESETEWNYSSEVPESLKGQTIYPVYIDQPKMMQADDNYYYYSFTAEEDGKYTFWLDGVLSYGYLRIFDGNEQDLPDQEYAPVFGTEFPAGRTVSLKAEQTCYIAAYGYSEEDSKVNLNVKQYEKTPAIITDLTFDRSAIEAGETAVLRINAGAVPVRKAVAELYYEAGSNQGMYSTAFYSQLDPEPDESGALTITIDRIEPGNVYHISNIVLLDEAGVAYELTYEGIQPEDVTVQVNSLQAALDQAALEGGTVTLNGSQTLRTDVVIPQNVTLSVKGSLYLQAALTVNGTLQLGNIDAPGNSCQLVVEGYTGGSLTRGENGQILDHISDGEILLYETTDGQITADLTDVRGRFRKNAFLYTASGEQTAHYEWRHGAWRAPYGSAHDGQIPEADEITELGTLDAVATVYPSEERALDEAWYHFTVSGEASKARLNLRLQADNNTAWYDTTLIREEDRQVVSSWGDVEQKIVLEPGKSYYLAIEVNNCYMCQLNVNAVIETDFISKEEVAAAFDFANVQVMLSESSQGNDYQHVVVEIPVLNAELVARMSTALYYGSLPEYTWINNEGFNPEDGVVRFSAELFGAWTGEVLTHTLEYMQVYIPDDYFYLLPGEDIPELCSMNQIDLSVGQPYVSEEILLGEEPASVESQTLHFFQFTAQEDGTYTFYTDQGGNINVWDANMHMGSYGYPYSHTEQLTEGETRYFLIRSYEEATTFNVTADTQSVTITNAAFETGTSYAYGQNAFFRVEIDGDVRQIQARFFDSTTGNYEWITPDQEEKMYWQGGNYHLDAIEVVDQYGRSRYFYDRDLPQIDFSAVTLTVISLNEYMRSLMAEGIREYTIDYLNGSEEVINVPEGFTLHTNQTYLSGSMQLNVSGSLDAQYLYVESNYYGAVTVGENGSILVGNAEAWSTGHPWTQLLTGRDENSSLNQNDGYYRWNGEFWKKQRGDGMPELDTIPVMEVGTSFTVSKDPDGNNQFVQLTVPADGVYQYTAEGDGYVNNFYLYNAQEDTYEGIGFGEAVSFREGEILVMELYAYGESFTLTMNPVSDWITAQQMAAALSLDTISVSKEDNGENVRVSVTQDLSGWMSETPIQQIEYYFSNGSRGTYLYWNQDEEQQTTAETSGTISVYGKTEGAQEQFRLQSVNVLLSNGRWYYFYLDGGTDDPHDVSGCHLSGEGRPGFTIVTKGPFVLKEGSTAQVPLNTSVWVSFTPQEDGDYFVRLMNNGCYMDNEGDWSYTVDDGGEGYTEYTYYAMTAGTTYLRQLAVYYESGDDDGSASAPSAAELTIVRDNAKVTLNGFTLNQTEVVTGQEISAQASLDVTDGELRNMYATFSNEDDTDSFNLYGYQVENGQITLTGTLYSLPGGTYTLRSLNVNIAYGKTWNFDATEYGLDAAVTVSSLQDYLAGAQPGSELSLEGIDLNNASLTIPEGVTVRAGYVDLSGGSTLNVEGSLEISDWLSARDSQVVIGGAGQIRTNTAQLRGSLNLNADVHVRNNVYLYNGASVNGRGKFIPSAGARVSFEGNSTVDLLNTVFAGEQVDDRIQVEIDWDEVVDYRWTGEVWQRADGSQEELVPLQAEWFTLNETGFDFTGSEITPQVQSGELVEGTDFTVVYEDNILPGEATAVISGAGTYVGVVRLPFTIEKGTATLTASLTGAEETADEAYAVTYGGSVRLQASASHSYGSVAHTGTLIYESSDEEVAAVTASGSVSIKKAGTVTLSVYMSESDTLAATGKESFVLTIRKAAQEISGLAADAYTMYAGRSISLNASAKTAITFVSDAPEVVSVDENGKVTARKAGSAQITVSAAADDCYEAAPVRTITVTVLSGDARVKLVKKTWAVGFGENSGDSELTLPEETLVSVVGGTVQAKLDEEQDAAAGEKLSLTSGQEDQGAAITLKGLSKGDVNVLLWADPEEGYGASEEVPVTVSVLEADAAYNGYEYINVSSALSAMRKNAAVNGNSEITGLITLLRNTANSFVLHLPSDRAVIDENMTVTLNLAKKQYNGALKVLGRLILRNTEPENVTNAKRVLGALADGTTGGSIFELGATGQIIIEKESVADIYTNNDYVSISGDQAKVDQVESIDDGGSGAQNVMTTVYYGSVEAAIEAANELAAQAASTDPGAEPSDPVVVELTDNAVITDTVTLDANVTLNLAGNALTAEGDAKVSGSGTVTSTVAAAEGSGDIAKPVIVSDNLLDGSVNVVEETVSAQTLPELKAADIQQSHDYDGKVPQLSVTVDGQTAVPEGYSVAYADGETGVGMHTYSAYLMKGDQRVASCSGQIEILPRTVNYTVSAEDKTYDGTTKALVTAAFSGNDKDLADLLTADGISLVAEGWFENADAGKNKIVQTAAELDGEMDVLNNYLLAGSGLGQSTAASIRPAAVTLPAREEIFDGNTQVDFDNQVHSLTAKEVANANVTVIMLDELGTVVEGGAVLPGTYTIRAVYEPANGNYEITGTREFSQILTIRNTAEEAIDAIRAIEDISWITDDYSENSEAAKVVSAADGSSKIAQAEEAIQKAQEELGKLDDNALGLVSQDLRNVLTDAERIVGDVKKAAAVFAAISALPEKEEITLENTDVVRSVRTEFMALTSEQEKLISEQMRQKLTGAEEKIRTLEEEKEAAEQKAEADRTAAQQVTTAITSLKEVDTLTLSDEDKASVAAARAAYDALTEDQKQLVSTDVLDQLEAAEAQITKLEQEKAAAEEAARKAAEEAAKKAAEDKAAAETSTKTITALKAVDTLTLADKASVEAARKAYDALTEDQKKLVSVVDQNKLKAAEAQIAKLEQEKAAAEEAARKAAEEAAKKAAEEAAAKKAAEEAAAKKAAADKTAAESSTKTITALKAADTLTLADKASVEAARKAYDALTADQKKLVSAADLKKLTDAEAKIKALAAKEAEKGDPKDSKSVAGTEEAVGKLSNSADPAGSSFAAIQLQSTKQTKSSITLKWNKVKGAKGYILYGNLYGKKYSYQRIGDTLTKTSVTVKKLADGTKLKKGTAYKFIVVAFKMVNGAQQVVAKSKAAYVATTGGKVTNAKKVTVKSGTKTVKKLSLKAKKKATLKATVTKQTKKLKLASYRKVRYESSNKKIATVTSKGKVTAKKKGTCYIYVYSQSGVFAKIKITVK